MINTDQSLAAQELTIIQQSPIYYIRHDITNSEVLRNSHKKYFEYVTANAIDGIWLEFGVYTGFTIKILTELTNSHVYGFDSFKGLPEDWNKSDDDIMKQGYFALNENDIRLYITRQFANIDNVSFVSGWFDQTLPQFVEEHQEPYAVIHIDCDLYASTKTILDILRPKLIPGTIILFDELHGYANYHQHEIKALLEANLNYSYLAHTNVKQAAIVIESSHTQ